MGIAVAHIALWTNRLEELRDFYVRYFDGESGPVYRNPAKGFESFFVGSREAVCSLTERLRRDGYRIAGEPRQTGDGYFESVVCDPDGNRIEIVA